MLAAFADKIFGFKGRLRRRDWWLLTVGLFVVQYAVTEYVIIRYVGGQYGMSFVGLLFMWPYFVIALKRLQDRDTTSRWHIGALVVAFLPTTMLITLIALFVTMHEQTQLDLSKLMYWLTLPANIYVFVVAGFLDGTPGPNRFGPSPKAKEFAKVS